MPNPSDRVTRLMIAAQERLALAELTARQSGQLHVAGDLYQVGEHLAAVQRLHRQAGAGLSVVPSRATNRRPMARPV